MLTGNQSSNISGTKYIDSRCIVEFRPNDDWRGEYGFDWFRRGDTFEKINGTKTKPHYVGIVGKYAPQDPDYGDDAGTLQTDKVGANPEKNYYADRLANGEYSVLTVKGVDRNYLVPSISLYYASTTSHERRLHRQMLYTGKGGELKLRDCCRVEAKIKLLISAKNINKIEFKCDGKPCDDRNIVTVSPNVMAPVSDGDVEKVVTVRLNHRFEDTHKSIKVFAYHKDGFTKTFAGQLNIVKCEPKTVEICFVNVRTRLNGAQINVGIPDFNFSDTQKDNLMRFLAQANIVPHITTKELDLYDASNYKAVYNGSAVLRRKGKDGSDIAGYLEDQYRMHYMNSDVYKIFFIGEKGLGGRVGNYYGLAGHANGIPSKALVIYKNPDPSVVCHELLHCFGLYHSFSNNSKHVFKKYNTSNIMDYSRDTISMWRWQWNIIGRADGVDKM